ncbi:Protein of unknown function [Gryllus bimaculatus]|nr:Protein of unknown function [Gryllus bimaculatus]
MAIFGEICPRRHAFVLLSETVEYVARGRRIRDLAVRQKLPEHGPREQLLAAVRDCMNPQVCCCEECPAEHFSAAQSQGLARKVASFRRWTCYILWRVCHSEEAVRGWNACSSFSDPMPERVSCPRGSARSYDHSDTRAPTEAKNDLHLTYDGSEGISEMTSGYGLLPRRIGALRSICSAIVSRLEISCIAYLKPSAMLAHRAVSQQLAPVNRKYIVNPAEKGNYDQRRGDEVQGPQQPVYAPRDSRFLRVIAGVAFSAVLSPLEVHARRPRGKVKLVVAALEQGLGFVRRPGCVHALGSVGRQHLIRTAAFHDRQLRFLFFLIVLPSPSFPPPSSARIATSTTGNSITQFTRIVAHRTGLLLILRSRDLGVYWYAVCSEISNWLRDCSHARQLQWSLVSYEFCFYEEGGFSVSTGSPVSANCQEQPHLLNHINRKGGSRWRVEGGVEGAGTLGGRMRGSERADEVTEASASGEGRGGGVHLRHQNAAVSRRRRGPRCGFRLGRASIAGPNICQRNTSELPPGGLPLRPAPREVATQAHAGKWLSTGKKKNLALWFCYCLPQYQAQKDAVHWRAIFEVLVTVGFLRVLQLEDVLVFTYFKSVVGIHDGFAVSRVENLGKPEERYSGFKGFSCNMRLAPPDMNSKILTLSESTSSNATVRAVGLGQSCLVVYTPNNWVLAPVGDGNAQLSEREMDKADSEGDEDSEVKIYRRYANQKEKQLSAINENRRNWSVKFPCGLISAKPNKHQLTTCNPSDDEYTPDDHSSMLHYRSAFSNCANRWLMHIRDVHYCGV